MKACDERIPGLVAPDELAPAERAELEAHLATCDGCRHEREELAGLESLLAASAAAPDELQLAGFARRAADRAEARRDHTIPGFWWALPTAHRLSLLTSTGALAAAFALFVAARPPAHFEGTQSEASPSSEATLEAEAPTTADDALVAQLDEEDAEETSSFDDAFDDLSADEIEALGLAIEHG